VRSKTHALGASRGDLAASHYSSAVLRTALLVISSSLLLACSPDKGFGESQDVSRDDHGSAWPLTVDKAVLTCSPEGDLFITIEGYTVDLEASSEADADRALLRSWEEQADGTGERMDLSPLVEDARDLC
jgi:hypothetical protein